MRTSNTSSNTSGAQRPSGRRPRASTAKQRRLQRQSRPTVTVTLPVGWTRMVLAGFVAAIIPWAVVVTASAAVFLSSQDNVWLLETTWNDVVQLSTRMWVLAYGVPIRAGVDDLSWNFSVVPLLATLIIIWFVALLARRWKISSPMSMWIAVPAHVVTVMVIGMSTHSGFVWWKLLIASTIIAVIAIVHALLVEERRNHKKESATPDEEPAQPVEPVIDFEADTKLQAEEQRIRETASSQKSAEAAIRALRAVYVSQKKREARQAQRTSPTIKDASVKLAHDAGRTISSGSQRLRDEIVATTSAWDRSITEFQEDAILGVDVDERVIRLPRTKLIVPGWLVAGLYSAKIMLLTTADIMMLGLVATIIATRSSMTTVMSGANMDWFAHLMMGLSELMFLPVFLVWAAAWTSGLGFQISADSFISPFHTDIGPVPQIHVFACLPTVQPGWIPTLIVVLLGFVAGVIFYLRKARPDFFEQVSQTLVAIISVTICGGILATLSSGSIGPGRFAHIGVDAFPFMGCILLEIGLPILIVMVLGHPVTRNAVSSQITSLRQRRNNVSVTGSDNNEDDPSDNRDDTEEISDDPVSDILELLDNQEKENT